MRDLVQTNNFHKGDGMKKVLSGLFALALALSPALQADAAQMKTYNLRNFGYFKFPLTIKAPKKARSCVTLTYETRVTRDTMYGGNGLVTLMITKTTGFSPILDGAIWSAETDPPSYSADITFCNYKVSPSIGYGPLTKGTYLVSFYSLDSDNTSSSANGLLTVN